MDARLIVVGGKANKSEVKLRLPATIGRSRSADLTVAHPKVSRQHCQIFERDGLLIVRDTGSLNGTYIQDNRIIEAILKPGDKLTIGPLSFVAAYETGTQDSTGTDDRTPAFQPSDADARSLEVAHLDLSDREDEFLARQSDGKPHEGSHAAIAGEPEPPGSLGPATPEDSPPAAEPLVAPPASETLFGASSDTESPPVEPPHEEDFRWSETSDLAETVPADVARPVAMSEPAANPGSSKVGDEASSAAKEKAPAASPFDAASASLEQSTPFPARENPLDGVEANANASDDEELNQFLKSLGN